MAESNIERNSRSQKRSALEWRALYEEHQSEGSSLSGFCRARGIAPSSYSKWRDKFSVQKSKFKKLEMSAPAIPTRTAKLEFPGGIVLTVEL